MGPDNSPDIETQPEPQGEPSAPITPDAAPAAASPMTGAPSPAPAAAPPAAAPAPPSPAAQVIAHQSRLGKIAMAAMGKQVTYQADPQTGVVTPVMQQRSFSDFARGLVGGLLMDAAVGQDAYQRHGGSVLSSVIAGGANQMQQSQAQALDARGQAIQDMKLQQDAQKQQQDRQAAMDQDTLRKAQIAAANQRTLQMNLLTQQKDLETHQTVANTGKAHFASYDDAGLKPSFDRIPESKVQETIQNNPGSSTLDWEPVDVQETTDQNGAHHFEYVYSAYDPKGEIPLADATVAQWQKDGFLDSLGKNAQDTLKPGLAIPANQYVALKNQHTQFAIEQQKQKQQDLANQLAQAKVDTEKAHAAQYKSSADANEARAHGVVPLRKARAAQTSLAADAGSNISESDAKKPATSTASTEVSRIGDSVMAGYTTLDDAGRGMGKEAAAFRRQVQDYILQKSGGKYDFEGSKQESKLFNSVPVQMKLAANETLTGRDGHSGLLQDLSEAAHAAGLTHLPALNDVQAWERIQSGSTAGVKAHQLMNDVAEQYGAIFANGGQTSDTKIKLAQENFPKNFNTAQIDEAIGAARTALGDRMRAMANHNRFIRSHYGAGIPVEIRNQAGQTTTTTMDKVDAILAKHPEYVRTN